MKKKFITYAILSLLGLAFLVGPTSALAMGFGWFGGFDKTDSNATATYMQTMFQNKATILGISVDKVKNCWTQGKSIWQCAEEQGITKEQLQQKMKDARTQQLKAQMQALVSKGVITQAQADQRLQWMQNKIQSTKDQRFGRFMMGMNGWEWCL